MARRKSRSGRGSNAAASTAETEDAITSAKNRSVKIIEEFRALSSPWEKLNVMTRAYFESSRTIGRSGLNGADQPKTEMLIGGPR
jgi:hypothetical protein